jgi:UPF0176 protein
MNTITGTISESSQVLNISFYKFLDLPKIKPLEELRPYLKEKCIQFGLKGTVLLAEEGINGFLAGPVDAIRSFQNLPEILACGSLPYKESFSEHQPFTRTLVKIKKEINK